jgi:deoxyribodipyrimidine photo-lyase
MSNVPSIRIRSVNRKKVSDLGDYVLYWMIANHRAHYNFSLQHAAQWAQRLNKPLMILETLSCDYPWASDRLHRFAIEGMAENHRIFADKDVYYFPFLEPQQGAGDELLRQLAIQACVVVSDDFPSHYSTHMTATAASRIAVNFEVVDSNGLLPMRAVEKVFVRAFDFRRHLQKNLLPHLAEMPLRDPLASFALPKLKSLPTGITRKWTRFNLGTSALRTELLRSLPIDHSVSPVTTTGGSQAASKMLDGFLQRRLSHYETKRNHPEQEAASGLSPYLQFGHISAHQVFDQLSCLERWTPGEIEGKPNGSARGWWGMSPESESFVDELITWRELGFNMCWQRQDYDQYESLPEWSQRTLAEHIADPRQHVYSLQEFESAQTHDALWNAAQTQLVVEGRIHNYLRMLWGKKILQWSATPHEALDTMLELNNKYALDGRNPNSYSGIFWVLGRYDRAWGPERPVFGKIRYMSSENTARKVRVKQYIQRYSEGTNVGVPNAS